MPLIFMSPKTKVAASLHPDAQRLVWLDFLRTFAFSLLILDHAAHAYAEHFGRFHFFKDFERGLLGDILYLHNNSIIMPLLFFVFGVVLFPALQKKGLGSFVKDRVLKLGLPYLIGIPLIVPLLVFPRYQFLTNPLMSYTEFWQDVYFQEKLQGGGPFWVLYCLALFTFVAVLADKLLPFLRPFLGRLILKGAQNPLPGMGVFIGISVLILGLSDLKWGAPWWIGFGHLEVAGETWRLVLDKIMNLFHLQGSRFLLHALYFIAGIGVSASGLLTHQAFWSRVSRRWPLWLSLMVISGAAYISYTLLYFEKGAYSDVVHRAVRFGGVSWGDAWPLIKENSPLVLVRTSLHGVFCAFQAMTYLSLCHRFFATPRPLLCHLAACSYGLFLLHEVPVIWGQYVLAGVNLPISLKIILLVSVGGGLTWGFVALLRRIPLVRKVLG